MADFDRSYHHNYSSSYSYNPRLSTDQNQNPPFSLNPSRPSTDQTSSYSYSYSYNTSRPSTDQAPPYDANNSYEYNGRLDIVPRQQPMPPAVVAAVGSSSGPWCFGDPEMKRKRRVASYKAYSVEGKVKSSLRKGFRWIKVKCSEIIHGW
ncbi:hypothetical protein FCM35_KLT12704 [Carex littledalei]|uniref:Uncharacterized protein n=1 Tax=Carex littledalei TaxID=544730 RepID=A0A833QEN5_9POAL|nr:hypothetical protein FCM35_KLT12704 [Carex littledalei]